jgi:hypothetical protein
MHPSGRAYSRTYERVRRQEHHAFLEQAVTRAGGRVLWSSGGGLAPLFLAIEDQAGVRTGVWCYAFWANRKETTNRPEDEHRLQIRLGNINDRAWREQSHPVGLDPTGLDVTVVLGVEPDADLIVGLDPILYDPLPMGISIFWKDDEVAAAQASGFHVWERDNLTGARRGETRSEFGVETVVAFRPERLFDFLRFEREAQSLRLDPPLRYRAAERIATGVTGSASAASVHELEAQYGLSAQAILEIIGERSRLAMAVRGGVAEHHLGLALHDEPAVLNAELGHQEGPPDYWVTLVGDEELTVECKNAAPKTYADGTPKVEVQKTRASRGDPASRFYDPGAFDVIAACMFGPTGEWTFRYKRSQLLVRHPEFPDRIAPLQRIDASWPDNLPESLLQM